MKNTHRFLIAAAALALFASAGQAKAGGTDACCNDGIAASPKVRAMLDERCKSRCAPARVTVTPTTRQTDIAASPRVRQMRSVRAPAPVAQVVTETAGYRPTGSDGITASPKVRAQLNERSPAVEIAPLK